MGMMLWIYMLDMGKLRRAIAAGLESSGLLSWTLSNATTSKTDQAATVEIFDSSHKNCMSYRFSVHLVQL